MVRTVSPRASCVSAEMDDPVVARGDGEIIAQIYKESFTGRTTAPGPGLEDR